MDKLPGAAVQKGAVAADQGDRQVRRQIAIINSMTPRERRNPGIIDGSRRRRIAAGAGVQVQDVNRLLKQFLEMQRVMKSMKGGRLRAPDGSPQGGHAAGVPGPLSRPGSAQGARPVKKWRRNRVLRRIRALFWAAQTAPSTAMRAIRSW